jgi:hypothetical protein
MQNESQKLLLHENHRKITNIYDWELITEQYAKHFKEIAGVLKR